MYFQLVRALHFAACALDAETMCRLSELDFRLTGRHLGVHVIRGRNVFYHRRLA
jgi:hypothetical protein